MKKIWVVLTLLIFGMTVSEKAYADTFYWIGGSGNWNDVNHWGKYSNAPYLGGQSYGRLPNENDIVIFDDYSFPAATATVNTRTCTVNVAGECHDLLFQGTGTYAPNLAMSNTLTVGGNLYLQRGMTVNGATQSIYFGHQNLQESGSYSITTNGVAINTSVVFRGNVGGTGTWTTTDYFRFNFSTQNLAISVTGGTWIAADSVSGPYYYGVTLTEGNIDWSGQYVSIVSFNSNNTNTRSLNIENAEIWLTVTNYYSSTLTWTYMGANSSLSASNSVINISSYAQISAIKTYSIAVNDQHHYHKITNSATINSQYMDYTIIATNIATNLTVDTLIIRRTAVLAAGITLTVKNYLEVSGCKQKNAFYGANTAYINMGTGNTNISHVLIRNLSISGNSITYPTVSCTDDGGNNGWSFTAGETYYWVGGTGMWRDTLHWSASSGGSPATGCIPMGADNVVFDDNSGLEAESVTIYDDAYCHDMIWMGTTGSPTLYISDYLNIFGSLELQQGMKITNSGSYPVTMKSNHAATITINDVVLSTYNNRYSPFFVFNGTGTWTLMDDLNTDASINFIAGNLVMRGITANIGGFYSSSSNTRSLDISNSVISINNYMDLYNIVGGNCQGSYRQDVYYGCFTAWTYNGLNSTLQAVGSHLKINYNGTYHYNTLKGDTLHKYNKVTFTYTGLVRNYLVTDTLILEDTLATLYFFRDGYSSANTRPIIKINNYFKADYCHAFKTMAPAYRDYPFNVEFGAGCNVKIKNANINYISATGPGLPYTVENSQLTSATGWNNAVSTNTYYWVGGEGNWNDGMHWATSSGGVAGSGCVPYSGDNVVFDENSGFTATSYIVTVSTLAYCNNMTWQGMATQDKPTLALNSTLYTSGSIEWQQGMTITGNGSIDMQTTTTATITNNGVIMPNLTFSGAGTLTVLDNINMRGNFNMTGVGAYLYMNNLKITVNGNFIASGSKQSIDISNTNALFGAFAATSTQQFVDMQNSVIEFNGSYNPAALYVIYPNTTVATNNSTIILNGTTVGYNRIYDDTSIRAYRKIVFMRSGSLANSLIVDSLLIGNEQVSAIAVTLPYNGTITVNSYLESVDCNNLKSLRSNNATTRANIAMQTNANIKIERSNLAYLNVTGNNTPYQVNNCIDEGGNIGLDFTMTAGADYYWVGGPGNWHDPAHWAISSGGTGGLGCVPFMNDNVFFDQNSGFTGTNDEVNITSTAYCKNMTWHNMIGNFPTLNINGIPLNIYGSLEWQQGMKVLLTFSSRTTSCVRFLSPDTVTITSNGVEIDWTLTYTPAPWSNTWMVEFNSTTGKWILTDDFRTHGTVNLITGNIDMKGIYACMGSFWSNNTNNRHLDISNSTIRLISYLRPNDYSGHQFCYIGNNGTLVSDGSVFYLADAERRDSYDKFATYPTNTIQKIVVENGEPSFSNATSVDSLIFKENSGINFHTYDANPTVTINKYFESLHCSGFNYTSKWNGTTTFVMGPNATVNVKRLDITALKITGPDEPYTARSSTVNDPDVSTGWRVSGVQDLYWVGGAGNWSDIQHWATSSGGTPGSGCIPMKNDNVFFDENSGFTATSKQVTVNTTANCNNMTWRNMDMLDKPTMYLAAVSLNIYGSLELQQGMTVSAVNNTATIINMATTDSVTVKTNGVPIYGYNSSITLLRFVGTGAYTVLDNLILNGPLQFTSGRLYMNGIKVIAAGLTGIGSAVRSLDIKNSTVNMSGAWNYSGSNHTLDMRHATVNMSNAWTVNGTNATLFADSSRINMNSTGAFTGISTHTYDTLVFEKRGSLANGTVLNTLILAQLFDYPNNIFYFPSDGTVTINRKLITGGTPCDMVNILSSSTSTPANISVPVSEHNIDPDNNIGFDVNFANLSYLNIVTGAGQAKVRSTIQSREVVANSLTGNWEKEPYTGLESVSLGRDTSMWCNATFPLNTDNFYGDHNTKYLWSDNSTANNLIITEFGDYWVKVNYSATCSVSDTIHVSKDDDLQLWGTASPSNGRMKVSLSTTGRSSFDPSPVFVLDSVQPAGAVSGLPLAQNSPDFYFSTPVRAFFSHTDALSGCDDICEVVMPVMAVSDTALVGDNGTTKVALLRNDFTYLENCTTVSTSLHSLVGVHGEAELSRDTLKYTPHKGWTGIDSLYYVLDVCGERDTAAVYFVCLRDTFDACPGVQITMTLPDVPGMSYVWYDAAAGGNTVSTSNAHTVTKDAGDDIGTWWISATWNAYPFPRIPVRLVDGTTSTAEHISEFSGDTLILANTSTTLTAHAVAEVVNPAFYWYDAPTGGIPFHTGDVYTTSVLTADTTFYVAVAGDNYCSSTERKAVTVHIIERPDAVSDGYTVLMNTTVVCDILANDDIPDICTTPPVIDVVTPPSDGSYRIENGKLVYTSGFSGRDALTYAVGCGAAVSDTVTVTILTLKPSAQQYFACPAAVVTLGFNSITNVTYNWYDDPTGGSLLKNASNTYDVTKDNSGLVQSYWVEPVYNGLAYPRLQVDLRPGDCEVISPSGCATDGTVIFKEDFDSYHDGANPASPSYSTEALAAGMTTYAFHSIPITIAGAYALTKDAGNPPSSTLVYLQSFRDDHTYPDDQTKGRFFMINGATTNDQLYKQTITGVCNNTELYFSFWARGTDALLRWRIYSSDDNSVLATFTLSELPSSINPASPWVQYGFTFSVPEGVNSVYFDIFNNCLKYGGNDFAIDDIEVRLCAPSVNMVRPTKSDTTVCEGSTFTFEGNYTDDGTFGNDLVYRWERNVTGDLNNPSDWSAIAGTEGASTGGNVSSDYTINPVAKSDSAHYRLVVANAVNIDKYNCRAMSDIIFLRTKFCLTSVTVDADDTVCYDVAPDELKLKTDLSNIPHQLQWQQSDDEGNNWSNVPSDGASSNYSPPALTTTTLYRLQVKYDGTTIYSNEIKVKVLPVTLLNYPDIRVRICPEANSSVNLSRYIDSLEVKSIQWTSLSSGISISPYEGIIQTSALSAYRVHTFTYTVSNTCAENIRRKAYIETLRPDGRVYLPKDTIVICHEQAEALLINKIFGVEAGGEWNYFSWSPHDIDSYVTLSTSSAYGGAVIINGKEIFKSSLPDYVYHGVLTKKIEVVYKTNNSSCLVNGKEYKTVIILTSN